MELKLENGRYVPAGQGALAHVSGMEELRQRILMKLKARRGGFSAMPEYGSRLYLLGRVRPAEREGAAAQYVAEALADEPELQLETLSLRDNADGSGALSLTFRCTDGTLRLDTTIQGGLYEQND